MNDYRAYATACIERLQQWYDWKTGLWTSTGWWNSANCLEAVIDFARLTKTDNYNSVIVNTFTKNKQGQFLNHYYDDEQWWALTWLKAYDLLQDKEYLAMASTIFQDVCTGWDAVCGGGLWWNKDRAYKGAIANELFITLAARLYQRTHDVQYSTWASKAWQWFLQSGLLNANHLINDGLTTACQNNGQTTWTYNQGVILGGIVELYTMNSTPSLAGASSIADAAISTLIDTNGILREPCEQTTQGCGQDGPQFKGIFMRNLSLLAHTIDEDQLGADIFTRYQQFMFKNADRLWTNNRLPDNACGLHWSGPVDSTDAARQSAALDAFNAALMVQERKTWVSTGQQQQASDTWQSTQKILQAAFGTQAPTSTGIYQSWEQEYMNGHNHGGPITLEFSTVNWSNQPIVCQYFAAGDRCEWDGSAHWYHG